MYKMEIGENLAGVIKYIADMLFIAFIIWIIFRLMTI